MAACILSAAEHHGEIKFGGLPVPGATVTATRGSQHFSTITDPMGDYRFADLPDGTWTVRVDMAGFSPVQKEVAVAPGAPAAEWDLQMLPFTGLTATVAPAGPAAPPKKAELKASKEAPAAPPAEPPAATDDLSQRAADGFLINGSQNNGASSPFALNPAFGNNRRGMRSLYQGSLGVILDNSSLDARSFSITGQDTPKPAYNRITCVATFGGPLRIPHLFRDGPNVFIGYQWTRNRTATVDTGLMPDAALRTGDFSQFPGTVLDPLTGAPFPRNVIPTGRISPQARALLHLYPLPNFAGSASYNYQIPVVGATHQDALQSRVNKLINRRNQVSGVFGYMNSRNDNPNLFGFLDTTDMAGLNTIFNWRHSFTPQFYGTLGLQFSRLATRVTPFFANRANVSGEAGITGNDQSSANWGPPALSFSSGISPLSDAQAAHNRNQTSGLSYDVLKTRNGHNFQFGGGFTRQEFNYFSQQDPRGSFSFTGAATGSDFASFLLGIPATSLIAYGNPDKYFRASLYNLYFTDDWRISPSFTLDAGVRWEYSSPITEIYGRLVNLDISPGFQAAAPVVASQSTGTLTGQRYPASLMNPDKHALQPRVGFAWRPLPASSMVVRGGYGVYYDTSVYQLIALQMAQQSPLSRDFSVQNTPATPLTLANGFIAAPSFPTFGVDPNFRIGYAQNWDLSVQRDLPGSLQMIATYLGIKGTRGMQEFFPNTYPIGGVNPCPLCTSGYAYLTSNGNSTR
ncbi:MAG TPA: carboxypeptidase regulatory-like domain-containing protein, partial [Bryobacteraceae bacterium]|nr:carboxypeptidase regulatory-like domain-containing protein [Bryobacteraceae bacterium]